MIKGPEDKRDKIGEGHPREKNRREEVNIEGGSDVPSISCLHYYSTVHVVIRRTTAVGCPFRVASTLSSGALQGRGQPQRRPGQSTARLITMVVAGPVTSRGRSIPSSPPCSPLTGHQPGSNGRIIRMATEPQALNNRPEPPKEDRGLFPRSRQCRGPGESATACGSPLRCVLARPSSRRSIPVSLSTKAEGQPLGQSSMREGDIGSLARPTRPRGAKTTSGALLGQRGREERRRHRELG